MSKIFMFLLMVAVVSACTPNTEVVNYRTITDPDKGIYYVYDGVPDKLLLMSGVGTDQTRVYITRQGR